MEKYDVTYERKLIKRLGKGNVQAFNAIFKEYSNRLFLFALSYLKSEVEAEELVQEVFTIIWEKRANLKDDLSFKSYIFTIAFNIIKKHFRTKAQLSKYFNYNVYNDWDNDTSQSISYENIRQYIKEIASQLPEKRKEIFLKSRFEGKKNKEISHELNISQKTVEAQLTHALKFIRNNINKELIPILLFCNLFIY